RPLPRLCQCRAGTSLPAVLRASARGLDGRPVGETVGPGPRRSAPDAAGSSRAPAAALSRLLGRVSARPIPPRGAPRAARPRSRWLPAGVLALDGAAPDRGAAGRGEGRAPAAARRRHVSGGGGDVARPRAGHGRRPSLRRHRLTLALPLPRWVPAAKAG